MARCGATGVQLRTLGRLAIEARLPTGRSTSTTFAIAPIKPHTHIHTIIVRHYQQQQFNNNYEEDEEKWLACGYSLVEDERDRDHRKHALVNASTTTTTNKGWMGRGGAGGRALLGAG